ncbi:hypothetical protein EK904_003766, partial [Melospiza melodia maxima]
MLVGKKRQERALGLSRVRCAGSVRTLAAPRDTHGSSLLFALGAIDIQNRLSRVIKEPLISAGPALQLHNLLVHPTICLSGGKYISASYAALPVFVGRCTRENCKYLHPPTHLKTQLEINGRNNLIQQKTAAAMLAQQMQFMFPGTPLQPVPTFPVGPTIGTNTAISFAPYLTPVTPGVGLVPTEILPTPPVIVPGSPPVSVPSSTATQKLLRTDKLEVCREFQRGNCARGETDCRFAHPADSTMIDTNDNTVTVCMDYIKGRCMREKCKYFHPPAHLQAKIKAAQHQANQAAVAAQAAAAAATVMAFPPGVLHPLPKRQALEKSNGASAVFNPSVLHYQQALANAQLQQHAAFIPTVPMMHNATAATVSAATTPATSVPFAATATANQ